MDDITLLLSQAQTGGAEEQQRLWNTVYGELKRMAAARMAGERRQVTMQATVLVHEVWRRLGGSAPGEAEMSFENRSHFFSVASEAMRRILVEQARRRLSLKRGGGQDFAPLEEAEIVATSADEKILEVHEALDDLERQDPRKVEIVRLHFFVGLTNEEICALLGLSDSTVRREWTAAKAWLFQAIQRGRGASV